MTELLITPVTAVLVLAIALGATSKLGGWLKLAEKFPVRSEFKGQWKTWQYARINWAGYKGCTWIGTTDDALYLKTGPGPIFSFGHPPMQIPWAELEFIETRNYFFKSYTKLSPRSMPDIILWLPEAVVAPYAPNLSRRLAH